MRIAMECADAIGREVWRRPPFFLLAMSIFAALPTGVRSAERLPKAEVRFVARPAKPATGPGNGIGYPASVEKRTAQRLARLRESLEQKRYLDALPAIQQFLSGSADAFIEDEQKPGRWRSVQSMCESWLAALPPDGREAYELQFGAEAKRLLEAGPEAWRLAARQYLPTRAGAEAAYRIAARRMLDGQPEEAARLLERLKATASGRSAWEPALSVRLAAALCQHGETERAKKAFDAVAQSHPGFQFALAGHVIDARQESRDWLLRRFAPRSATARHGSLAQWPHFGGTSERRSLVGEQQMEQPPHWAPSGVPTVIDPLKLAVDDGETAVDRLLATIVDSLRDQGRTQRRHWWPRSQPIVVGDVLVFRSLGNVRGVDLFSGKRLWESMPDEPLERLLVRDGTPDESSPSLRNYIDQRMWDDACAGRLGSDGERVYAVEDSGSAYAVDNPSRREQEPPSAYNRLAAYDVGTGRLQWELGGPEDDAPLPEAGTFFLGSPLAVERRLFVLSEKAGMIRLQEIQPEDGVVVWTQPLAEMEANWSVSQNPNRRLSGFSPSCSKGILICPTGVGLIAAVDLLSRRLLWIEELPLASMIDPDGFQQTQPQPADASKDTGWVDGTPVIADNRVLIPRPGGHPLYCLSLDTGARQWALYARKLPNNARWLSVDPENRVVIVGERSVQAYDIRTGDPQWKKPLTVPTPCGAGFIAGRVLHLPAREATSAGVRGLLLKVDLGMGTLQSNQLLLKDQQPGNLAYSQGLIVSQGAERLHVFGMPSDAPVAEAETP